MDADKYNEFKNRLKGGPVQVVVASQLFETPDHVGARMVELADIQAGDDVLEPSAGRGALALQILNAAHALDAKKVLNVDLTAVEIDPRLYFYIKGRFPAVKLMLGDFLHIGELEKYDRIIMNPPFVNGSDIAHIKHAAGMLKSGGRLVALCADGPRQRAALQSWATTYETLPPGTFKDAGTMVNTAMVTYERTQGQ